MRFIPVLLMTLLAAAPLSYAMATSSAETDLPVSLDELKLGELGWKFPLNDYAEGASAAWTVIDGEDLFLLDSRHTLHCLKLNQGVHKWILELPGAPSFPMGISQDALGLVIKDRMILVRRATGSRYLDKALAILPATAPAVTMDAAYVGLFIQNRMVSVDADTGIAGWSYRFKDFVMVPPRIYGEGANKFLYVAATDGAVIALSPKPARSAAPTKPEWIFTTQGPNRAEMAFAGDLLLVASEDSSLYAFNRLTGYITWKHFAGVPLTKAPQVVGNNVYQLSDKTFACLSLENGAKKWTYDGGVELATQIQGVAYVTTGSGTLAILDAESGKLFKEAPLIGGVKAVPNVHSEMLILQAGTDLFGLK
jgi:outer membrane protein assembly factor BamB